MSNREGVDDMGQLLQAIAADWALLRTIRQRLPLRVAQARRGGVPGRVIARETQIPERNVRRWSESHLSDDDTAGAA